MPEPKITISATNRVVTHPHGLSPPVRGGTSPRMPAEPLTGPKTKNPKKQLGKRGLGARAAGSCVDPTWIHVILFPPLRDVSLLIHVRYTSDVVPLRWR